MILIFLKSPGHLSTFWICLIVPFWCCLPCSSGPVLPTNRKLGLEARLDSDSAFRQECVIGDVACIILCHHRKQGEVVPPLVMVAWSSAWDGISRTLSCQMTCSLFCTLRETVGDVLAVCILFLSSFVPNGPCSRGPPCLNKSFIWGCKGVIFSLSFLLSLQTGVFWEEELSSALAPSSITMDLNTFY